MSFLSAVLGLDASHNAGQAQQQSQQQMGLANQYGTNAANQYGLLSGMGLSNYLNYANNINPLLAQYAQAAGLPYTPTFNTPSVGELEQYSQAQQALSQAQGLYGTDLSNLALQQAQNPRVKASAKQTAEQNILNQDQAALQAALGAFAGGQGGNQATRTAAPGQAGAGQPSSQNAAAQNFNPYQLTAPQQQELNAQLDTINRGMQSATAQLKADYAANGITNSDAMNAGVASLQQQYNEQLVATQANYLNTIQQQREQASQGMLAMMMGLNPQAAQQIQGGAGGIQGVAGQMMAGSGQQAQNALAQQQLANQQYAGIGSFLGQLVMPWASQNLGQGLNKLFGIGTPTSAGNAYGQSIANNLMGGYYNPF